MIRGPALGAKIVLGKMIVGEQIGAGGFGVVHQVELEGIDGAFAAKFLHPTIGNDDLETATKRFFREAQVLFRLRHAHIVPIYGVGEHEGRPYILMEKFEGYNLIQSREKVGQPDPTKVLPFIERVADALAYAHRMNVVHRDIKPQNLMTIKGDARVLDFGVAGLIDPNGERFTRTGEAIVGDVFSAPELTENPKLIDPRCDVYSVGACWYWLLTGMSAKGVNWEAKLRASVNVPREYERVLLRCLDQADRRYGSASELVDDVRALQRGDAPALAAHDLTDEQVRVLGVVVGACPTRATTVSFYGIEQEVGKRQSRLRTSLALRALVKRGFVSEEETNDSFGDGTYTVYQPADDGTTWADRHLARIEELLRVVARPTMGIGDEIPF